MTTTESVTVHPLVPESDLTGLLELLGAITRAEGRANPPTAEQMQAALTQPDTYRWLAFAVDERDTPIGYGVLFRQTTERCYGDARVHPQWRRRGVGRLLVDQLVEKAAALETPYLSIDVAATNQDALRFLLSQGFRYRGDVWALELPPDVPLPAPEWPAGYTVQTFAQADDLARFVDLCHQTFSDLWGHWENTPGMVTVERMAEWLTSSDPDGVFIVSDATGTPAAQCRTFPAAADAPPAAPHTLDQPGVAPAHRAAVLHRPLALTAAHWLRDRSPRPIRLESWGDSSETIAIYESLGFALDQHEVSYVREVAA